MRAHTLQKHLARVENNKNDGFSDTRNNDNNDGLYYIYPLEETPQHERGGLHLKDAYSHTDQLNRALRHHAVQCQHAPIILQSLAIQTQLLPLRRCVGGEGLRLEVIDCVEPRADREGTRRLAIRPGNVDTRMLWSWLVRSRVMVSVRVRVRVRG